VKIIFSEEVKAGLRTLSKEDRREYIENAVAEQLAKDGRSSVVISRVDDVEDVSSASGSGWVVGGYDYSHGCDSSKELKLSGQEWLQAMVHDQKIPFRTREGLSGSVQISFEGSDTQ